MINWTTATERAGLIAVIVSLLYVGYEIKRNNDLAIVESQKDLVGLNIEMKGWLVDKEVREIIFTDDIDQLSEVDLQTFIAMAGSWFDLYEHAFLAYERGVLSDEQLHVWKAGLCACPPAFFEAFDRYIFKDNYLDALVSAVAECQSLLQKP